MQSNVEDRKALSVEHDSPVSIVEQPLLVAYRAAPNEPTSQASSGSASVFSFSRIFNRTASGTGTSEHLIDSSSMSSPQRGYPQLASFPGESPIQIPLNTDDPVPERNNDLNLDLSGQRVPVPNHRSGRGEPLEGDTDFDPRAADKPPKPKKSKQRSAQRAPFSPSGEDAEMAAKRDASLRDIIQHLDTSGRPGRQGSEEKFADDNEDGFKKPERDVLVPLELNTVHGRDGIGKMSPSHEGGTWASVAAWKYRQWHRVAVCTSILSFVLLAVVIGLAVKVGMVNAASGSGGPSYVQPYTCSGVSGDQGLVSTTHELATQVGLDVLKKGGTAVDAAVAVFFVLNVVQPQSTGIGGGSMIVFYDSIKQSVHALDGREEAPARAHGNMFCQETLCATDPTCTCQGNLTWPFDERKTGGHPVGVPGALAAAVKLLEDHGSWSLAETMEPAIRIARNGFAMYDELRRQILLNKWRLGRYLPTARLFLPRNGEPLNNGELFKNPDLATTFELIAKDGVAAFYNGPIAQDIVAAAKAAVNPVTNLAGLLELSDLQSYAAVYRTPTVQSYRNYTVVGMGMPSSGGATMGLMLNMLEEFDIPGSFVPVSRELYHRLIDIQDVAFADRNSFMADADFVDVPVEALLKKEYARTRVEETMSPTVPAQPPVKHGDPLHPILLKYGSMPEPPKLGTTHFSIIDSKRNIVAFTTTIEENLGAAVVVPNRGFLLNNELTDFAPQAIEPESGLPYANAPAGGKRVRKTAIGVDGRSLSDADAGSGGKRPLSSMNPTLVFHRNATSTFGSPYLSLGAPGGSRIIGSVFHTLVNLLDFELCPKEAIDARRFISRNQVEGAEGELLPALFGPLGSSGTVDEMIQALTKRGFKIRTNSSDFFPGTLPTYVQVAQIRADGSLIGEADRLRFPPAKAMAY